LRGAERLLVGNACAHHRLARADLPRRNDLDGRGALSQEELVYGLLTSQNRVGPVSFNAPLRSLRWLFPRLWPEADDSETP
jgi:hypothetical protein